MTGVGGALRLSTTAVDHALLVPDRGIWARTNPDVDDNLDVRAQFTFVLTLLLLEAGGNFSDEGRHVLFSATSSLMTFVLMARSLRSLPTSHPIQALQMRCPLGG